MLLVALAAAYVLLIRVPGPGEIPEDVVATASDGGCAPLERPVTARAARDHLSSAEAHTYGDPPAASGPHDPSPLEPDPHVRDEPVDEARAVHNLEHAYVLVYVRPAADGGPAEATADALAEVAAEQDRVIMAPNPDLPDGTGIALVAWNTRWLCPASLGADDAARIASAFIDAYRGTTNAPEAPRGLLGPWLVP